MKNNDIYFSKSKNTFYLYELKPRYDLAGTWPTDAVMVSAEVYNEFTSEPPPGKMRGGDDNGTPAWIDIPVRHNSELLKAELATLSSTYQDDIEKLNRAWLAAAVSDGVNESAKKDAVLEQINKRKIQYANDRASIIARYK
ncbi:TPA: tail fiber assembly protein [Escherichia coli]|nr:tail fiber assembly protein [Escherichia coli]HAV8405413.1 tail fiber assembly protein [Escherichia coli]HAV8414292.1 tail fiber assembly protein [Escherichia coli]